MVATCGSKEKAALLKRLGADRVINYRREDLKAVLRAEYPKARSLVPADKLSCAGRQPLAMHGGASCCC